MAVFLGWAFAGERLTPLTFVAAGVILAAVIVITTFRDAPLPTSDAAPAPSSLTVAEATEPT